jgi:MFS family permease
LIEKDREDQAIAVLRKFSADNDGNTDEELLFARYQDIRAQIKDEQQAAQHSSKWHLFTKPSLRKRLVCGVFTQFILQFTGVLVINNYQVLLYNTMGLYNSLPLLLYAVYLSWAAGMNYISSLIIDKVGRVRLMMIGIIGCVGSVICYTAMIAEYSGTTNLVGNGFGVFFLFLFVTFYGGCLDATSYVYCAEIFPTHHRATGMGISILTQFCTTLVYTQLAPLAFATIGWRYYLVFILVPAAGAVVFAYYFPEASISIFVEEFIIADIQKTSVMGCTRGRNVERGTKGFRVRKRVLSSTLIKLRYEQ